MTFCDLAEANNCDSLETMELRRFLVFLRWKRLMEIYW